MKETFSITVLPSMKNIIFGLGIFLLVSCNYAQKDVGLGKELKVEEFKTTLESGKGILVDVRTKEEFDKGHIPNSLNANLYDKEFLANLERQVSGNPERKPIYVYCLSGVRSEEAAAILRKKGKVVYGLKGGVIAWRNAGNLLTLSQLTNKDKTISLDQYKQLYSTGKPVLVVFYGEWCLPCRKMKPYLDEIAASYKGEIEIRRVSYDDNRDLCDYLHIDALPFMIYYDKGKLIWENNGFLTKEAILKKLGI